MGMLIRRVAMGLPLVVMERTADDGEGGRKCGGASAGRSRRGADTRQCLVRGGVERIERQFEHRPSSAVSKSVRGSNRERKGGDVWLEFGRIGNGLLLQARVCIDKQRAT